MRALIIISASFAIVMEPSSTWATNSFTRSLPRSFEAASTPNRPCSTIWSRRLDSVVSTAAVACALAAASAIGALHFALQLVQFFGVADGFEQQFFQLVVALQRAAEIGEA